MNAECKILIRFFALLIFLSSISFVYGGETKMINATVKLSVCGNDVAEPGEDCDNADINGYTCNSLGYTGGNLSCKIDCDFDTSSCNVPSIDPTNVHSTEVVSLLAAGYLSIPSTESIISTSSLATEVPITINIPVSTGTTSIELPDNVVITRIDGNDLDPMSFTVSSTDTSLITGFSGNVTVDGAVQLGIPNIGIQFDNPIQLHISVGTSLNGETLNVVRSEHLDTGWTSDGIVAPATCVISNGLCSFQTTKASYFAVTKAIIPTSTPTPTPGATSSTETTSTNLSNTSVVIITPKETTPKSILPKILQLFYADASGKISLKNIFNVVKKWVDAWKDTLLADLSQSNIDEDSNVLSKRTCDVNSDGDCTLKDLSILLYYVER